MHDPDWERYQAYSRAGDSTGKTFTALGDPSRWGALVDFPFPQGAGLFENLSSPQVLKVQCGDAYSRAWSILGTVTADNDIWAYGTAAFDPAGQFLPFLQVLMGVGQNVVQHNFNLRAIIDADAPFYLALNDGGPLLTKPFVIPGALIGNAISVRIGMIVFNPAPVAFDDVKIAAQLAPFNAGTGL